MRNECPILAGQHIRLEPIEMRHLPGLLAAANGDRSAYTWTEVPSTEAAMMRYMDAAMAARAAGTSVPLVTVLQATDRVIGSTRFFDLDRWAWPAEHPRSSGSTYDGCEVGWTWLTADAMRTAANSETKLLLLTHAFERWNVLRVQLSTDARNERSAAAIARLGAKLDGTLRAQKLAVDLTPRTSLRFSILAEEWPAVKARLRARLAPS